MRAARTIVYMLGPRRGRTDAGAGGAGDAGRTCTTQCAGGAMRHGGVRLVLAVLSIEGASRPRVNRPGALDGHLPVVVRARVQGRVYSQDIRKQSLLVAAREDGLDLLGREAEERDALDVAHWIDVARVEL